MEAVEKVIDKELQTLERAHSEIVITSSQTFEVANSFLKAVKDRIKEIESQRTDKVRPLNEEVKRINAEFKAITEYGEKIKIQFENKIKAYLIELQKEEEKKQAELRKIQLEKLKAEQDALEKKALEQNSSQVLNEAIGKEIAIEKIQEKPLEVQKTFGTEVKSTLKKVWRFEIKDEDLIPRAYLMVDEVKIRKFIGTGVREIPGVRIYEDVDLSQRRSNVN